MKAMKARHVWIAVLALPFLASHGTARAATITAEASAYVAGADPQTVSDTGSGSDQAWAYAETGVCDEWWWEYCSGYEWAYGAAYGTADGDIRVGAGHYLGLGGEGEWIGPADGSGYASVTWEDTMDIDPNSPYFAFTVNQGWVGVGGDAPGSGTLTAWYSIEIFLDDQSVWSSAGTLEAVYDDVTGGWSWDYDDSSDLLNGSVLSYETDYDGDGVPDYINVWVGFAEQTLSADLSTYAGQQDVPIRYVMEVAASDPSEVGFGNWAEARFGDPFPPQPQPIPEPGTLILVGSGIAGLGALRSRRRRKAAD